MPKRPVGHLEQFGGARLHSTRLLQSLLDERAFNIGDELFEVQAI